MMPNVTLTPAEIEALLGERDAFTARLQALAGELEAMKGELKVTQAERDLWKQKFQAHVRKLFAAKSEARGSEQRDLFFNEAEYLAPTGQTEPPQEETAASSAEVSVTVAAHQRQKRGRKPLDAALPREIVRHELPASARVCPLSWRGIFGQWERRWIAPV